MVCTTPPTGGGHPHPPSHNTRALNRPSGSRAPSGEQKNPLLADWRVSGEIFLQKAYQDKLQALSSLPRETSTQKQYKSCWSKWVGWCHKQQVDPIQPTIVKVVDFLSVLFQSGSAISSTIPPMDASPVGQHPLGCKFMKGAFDMRPPQPKYSHTWDVALVTKYLENPPNYSDLPISTLTTRNVLCY